MSSTWFHGMEHLTVDDEGFVRWKGQIVERFKPELAESDAAKGRAKNTRQVTPASSITRAIGP